MGAGEALRRVLECLASGILLAGMDIDSPLDYVNLMFVLSFLLKANKTQILLLCYRWRRDLRPL